ncbi:MAG: metal-dependent hydrolase [Myxococcota bacterium]
MAESVLTPRRPRIDFADADPVWLPIAPRFAHQQNGASLLMPYLEPFLIRVIKTARVELEEKAPHLVPDVDVFCRQEANHYKLHAAYNRELLQQYPGLDAFEAEIREDFERFLPERGLEWCLAYSEGFECTGLMYAEFVLEEIDDLMAQGDPKVAELWRWHLAEEFEHRSVTHDVLEALHPGWWRRMRGIHFCSRHLFGFTGRVKAFMIDLDIERGRLSPEARDLPSERQLDRRQARFMRPRLMKLLSPRYDPSIRTMGANTRKVLASYA